MLLKNPFTQTVKRSGKIAPFDKQRIANAVYKAMQESGEGKLEKTPMKIADEVVRLLAKRFPPAHIPQIEEIQDAVEEVLILEDYPKTVKAYILYRNDRARVREQENAIPEHVQVLAKESKKYFRSALGEFVYYRTYSRWIEDEGRRETWMETVDRFMDFMKENVGRKYKNTEYDELREAILNQEIMPSMRLFWSSGKAARATNVCAYNCSYVAPTKLGDFAEIMYVLMCGTGAGFSVESQNVQQLPIIKHQTGKSIKKHVIKDSKEGWCNALTLGLKTWYNGEDVEFDFSEVRPAGTRLQTMGGRSSGPEPLKYLLEFARDQIMKRQGKRLSNLDVHDIICKIGEIVVVGGVRRSALISLSNLDDDEMRDAKKGQFYLTHPQRSMANNSATYNEKPTAKQFMQEWLALIESETGERGIFNRGGLEKQLPKRRWGKFKKHLESAGTNPCGEIVLRSKQFCNLTEVVARSNDTEKSLLRKVRLAAMLGTYQASLTNFKYLSKEWEKNCKEESLLGVSITGQWDSPAARNAKTLEKMKKKAIQTNITYAKRLHINQSTCITCVKPSGNVSQLVDSASGMHPRFAPYYIRRVRISSNDPLCSMLIDQKYPHHPEVGQSEATATTYVFDFPVQSPKGSIFKDELSAMEQLEHWKKIKESYTEHNPSVTIYVGGDEWLKTANWLYENWDILGGLSFLPRDDHAYELAPYEEIDEKKYKELKAQLPPIDFSQILAYEKEDHTQGAKELACVGNVCELGSDEVPSK